MATKNLLVILVIIAISQLSTQNTENNLVNDENPLREAANEILKEQNLQNLGGMVNNFLQGGGGKEIGNILSNIAGSKNAGVGELLTNFIANGGAEKAAELLQTINNVPGKEKGDSGFDPELIGSLLNQFGDLNENHKQKQKEDTIMSLLGSFLSSPGNSRTLLEFLPTIMNTINNFIGPEAEGRERQHSDHASLMPPLVEKFHLLFDHFMNSEVGKNILSALGTEKFVKIFADSEGNIDYQKVVDMLENHSFRKHWIRMVTDRIAFFLDQYSDPKKHKMFMSSAQIFVNSWLRGRGYPKSVMLDYKRPVETLSALINYVSKTTFNERINSRQYVQPAVEYVQDLFRLSQSVHSGGDHTVLSNKIADTINLEIIEPIARVNRAYRYAKSYPECDKYIFCLVNDKSSNEKSASLPGLRQSLSKATSMIYGWFLSGKTGTSFWTLYSIVHDDQACQPFYKESCEGFHIEEHKVTTEYVHNEL